MRTIHYISYYNYKGSGRLLGTQPSAISKIDYISDSLIKAGFKVNLVTLSEGRLNERFKVNYFRKVYLSEHKRVIFLFTFSRNGFLLKLLSRFLVCFQLLVYLLFKVKEGDRILVYHSLSNMWFFRIYNHFTSNPIYLEIEEVYNAVYHSVNKINGEVKYFNANSFSGCILVNDIIAEKCHIKMESIICYGKYNVEAVYRDYSNKSDTINIVYAGSITSLYKDAYLAVELARYLSKKYRIFILGFGPDSTIENLNQYIDKSNMKNECKVSYEGCLQGESYLRFLSQCQIGLCTRALEDELSDYTFPSKIMAYLSYGLIPVCTPISCVQKSKVSDLICFSRDVSAKSIALAVKNVDLSLVSLYEKRLNMLDNEFISSLQKMFD